MTGPRKKTTIMLPEELDRQLALWGRRLGTGKNGLVSVAVAQVLAEVSGLDPQQKRRTNLLILKQHCDAVFTEAEKDLV